MASRRVKFKVNNPSATLKDILRLPVHPLANELPMESDEDLRLLGRSLRIKQRQPVVVANGQVIDGRNRLKAAHLEGLKTIWVEFHINVTEQYIDRLHCALNLNRRDLTPRRRAELALEYYQQMKKLNQPVTIKQAASRYKASVRTVNRLISDAKYGKLPPVARLSMGKIPKHFEPMVVALNLLSYLKSDSDEAWKYRKYSVLIKQLSRKILAEEKLAEAVKTWVNTHKVRENALLRRRSE